MDLPIRKENNELPSEIYTSGQIVSRLTDQYFTGRNGEILNEFLLELSCKSMDEFMTKILSSLNEEINLEEMNLADIEQLDLIGLAKKIASTIEVGNQVELSDEEKEKFEDAFKDFSRSTLHNVAFPMMVIENANVAVSAKNLVKRTLSSLQTEEGVDLSKVYAELGIEDLPTEMSLDLFLRLGGNIQGLEKNEEEELPTFENEDPPILFCELTTEQVVYLCNTLQEDYDAIRNWKSLYNLLKSNGKKYDSCIVDSEKKGILLSVLDILHERRNIAEVRYIRTNKRNGIWPFFKKYLIDSKTDKLFERPLHKLRHENCCAAEAKKIVDEIMDIHKQITISQRAKEIIEKCGI